MSDERPLYIQVREWLTERILQAPLGVRYPIPTEPKIAAATGVSRGTVRNAVDGLVESGLLVRKQGQGTFVVPETLIRMLVASRLENVAKPDSRYDRDFSNSSPILKGVTHVCAGLLAFPNTAMPDGFSSQEITT